MEWLDPHNLNRINLANDCRMPIVIKVNVSMYLLWKSSFKYDVKISHLPELR